MKSELINVPKGYKQVAHHEPPKIVIADAATLESIVPPSPVCRTDYPRTFCSCGAFSLKWNV